MNSHVFIEFIKRVGGKTFLVFFSSNLVHRDGPDQFVKRLIQATILNVLVNQLYHEAAAVLCGNSIFKTKMKLRVPVCVRYFIIVLYKNTLCIFMDS